jgi:hypothetical protein
MRPTAIEWHATARGGARALARFTMSNSERFASRPTPAGTDDASLLVLATHPHPSWRHAGNEKLRSVPALRTDLRQMTPAVVADAVTICALSYEMKA